MLGEPPISVIMAARDAAGTIGESIDSMLAQRHSGWELIVVDDGSGDATAEIVARSAAADARIRLVASEGRGVSAARNSGIAHARHDLLLFFDADDVLTEDALAALVAPMAADPGLTGVYGDWIRQLPDGTRLAEGWPGDPATLPEAFTRTCAFVLHAALVRREAVVAAGAFDPGLTTCEDWDLWQRLTRAGQRWARLERPVAVYRVRLGSASNDSQRMLADALTVIARGHAARPGAPAPPWPEDHETLAVAHFAIYIAGLALDRPAEALALLARGLPGHGPVGLDPANVAEILFRAVPLRLGRSYLRWSDIVDPDLEAARPLLDALEQRSDVPLLAARAARILERRIAETDAGATLVGTTAVTRLDVEAPIADEVLPEGADRLAVHVQRAGRTVGVVTVAACDGRVGRDEVRDAVANRLFWPLLEEFLETEPGGEPFGWPLFLRELWRDADTGPPLEPVAPSRSGPVLGPVELARPLPPLPRAGGTVVVALGGAPLGIVEVGPGILQRGRLIAAVDRACGAELARVAVREGVLGAPFGDGTLRERLARAASSASEPAAVARLGRRDPRSFAGPGMRVQALPGSRAPAVLAAAAADGRPRADPPDGSPGRIRADPAIFAVPAVATPLSRRSSAAAADLLRRASARARRTPADRPPTEVESFDELFARDAVPWDYDTPYEVEKYERTLELMPAAPAGRVLEVACAEGHFTQLLVARGERVTAADVSVVALERTRARCGDTPLLSTVQRDLFSDRIPGRYDVVVCGEVLYYAGTPARLRFALEEMIGALRPGGAFITAHANVADDAPGEPGFDWAPFGSVTIDAALRQRRDLRLDHEIRTPMYRLQRWQRTSAGTLRPRRTPLREHRDVEAPLSPEVAAHFLPAGGRPVALPAPRPDDTQWVPVLMWHRIADEGASATRRWRTTPPDFAAQLRHLQSAGYRSLSAAELGQALVDRRPLPGLPVVLTFDDATSDFADTAWPMLSAAGFGATLFPVTGLAGATNRWDEAFDERIDLLGWGALAALARAGVEIGSHSATHRPLTGLGPEDLVDELLAARADLRTHLPGTGSAIAYPYGDVDHPVADIAGALGHTVGFTTADHAASLVDDPLLIPRIEVRGDQDLAHFRRRLAEIRR